MSLDEPTAENLELHLDMALQTCFSDDRSNPPQEFQHAKAFVERILAARFQPDSPVPAWAEMFLTGRYDVAEWVRFAIAYELAQESINGIPGRVGRVWDLASMMKPISLSKRAMDVFSLVSRCYVSGFDDECIVMCRALVETEIEAEISNDDCVTELGQRRRGEYFSLHDKVAVATKRRRLSYDGREAADRVRSAGNKCVHPSGEVFNVRELILDTVLVLKELEDSRS